MTQQCSQRQDQTCAHYKLWTVTFHPLKTGDNVTPSNPTILQEVADSNIPFGPHALCRPARMKIMI